VAAWVPQYDIDTDSHLQVIAAVSLLEWSRLVHWCRTHSKFVAVDREGFELRWKQEIDPVFGRLICWVNFSAGAEFLAKGVCLLNGLDFRKRKKVPRPPREDVPGWIERFRNRGWDAVETAQITNFGTLKNLYMSDTNGGPALQQLCAAVNATRCQKDMLLVAYEFLARTIRNRDAHAYVPNVRDQHQFLVPGLFADCFNLLVSWLPDGPSTLNTWRDKAKQFVGSLSD
jgi:hypothetical protein